LHPLLVVVAILLSATIRSVNAAEVNVAVAANFSAPAQQIAALFQQESGHAVKLSFGSSGKLYAQIKNGAPFDVFLSGDEKIPQRLEQEGFAVKGSQFVYAPGKLVLWSAQAGFVDSNGAVLRTDAYNKLAVADAKLAPYGLAAKETLKSLELWNTVQRKLVTGESVTQTYQFAATGNAKLAFIALSQVYKNDEKMKGSYWIVPSSLYQPIKQSAVRLTSAKHPTASQAFLDFLRSKQAITILHDYGYDSF
jgi:molybdate transport system substrate-binding protein